MTLKIELRLQREPNFHVSPEGSPKCFQGSPKWSICGSQTSPNGSEVARACLAVVNNGPKLAHKFPRGRPRRPRICPKSSQWWPKIEQKWFRRHLRRFRGSPKRPKWPRVAHGTQISKKLHHNLARRCLFYTIHILTHAPVLPHQRHGNLPGVPIKVCRCESQIGAQIYLFYPKLSNIDLGPDL